jgi:hypothetical protein
MSKIPKDSDSSVQREIENIVRVELENRLGYQLKTEPLEVANGIFVEIDAYNEEEKILIEIYAGIDSVKSGQLKKVMTDAYKLNFVEKRLEWKGCKKILCFVDDKVRSYFDSEKNWYSLSLKEFGIITEIVNLSEVEYVKLKEAKKKQFR